MVSKAGERFWGSDPHSFTSFAGGHSAAAADLLFAEITSARWLASCQTPHMNGEARRDNQARPRKYSPGTFDAPFSCTGLPFPSNASSLIQLKSRSYPVAQMMDVTLALCRLSDRTGFVKHSGSGSLNRASGSSGKFKPSLTA